MNAMAATETSLGAKCYSQKAVHISAVLRSVFYSEALSPAEWAEAQPTAVLAEKVLPLIVTKFALSTLTPPP